MEQVSLSRYQVSRILGAGADYEVRAAVDLETDKQVVLKRPKPQMVSRQLHAGIEARTDRILEVRQELGYLMTAMAPILGYTERTNHDAFFGESLGQEYRVLVEERALGVPLVGDPMAKVTGVPIGIGQNLFTLFPLIQPDQQPAFLIHKQLLDLEEVFYNAGYVLLDLRPQNIFYQPASGRITVIDCGALVGKGSDQHRGRRPPQDINDFYLEMLKFYTTPQAPPTEAAGYKEPYGLRPVVRFEQELEDMARRFGGMDDSCRDAALLTIGKVHDRKYTSLDGFRRDLLAYLDAVGQRNTRSLDNAQVRQAWFSALGWLRGEYWQRFLFDPDAELAVFNVLDTYDSESD